jgi:RimJ/RimL family protein N-acetyltransferase
MHIVRWDPADADAAQGCYEVWESARKTDEPLDSPIAARSLRTWLERGWTGEPCETWLVPGAAGSGVDGLYRMELPRRENADRAQLHILVPPVARRRGVGTALLRHAARQAAAHGRVVFGGEVREDSAGAAFARQTGATPGLVETRRTLDVRAIPDGQTARLREEATAAAAGYSLVSWTGVTPEAYLAKCAAVANAMSDAPRGEGVAAESWDAERVRTADEAIPLTRARAYAIAALHDASGEMAAISQVNVDPEVPDWGHQSLTAVSRPHRGHRLGLLVKAAMLDWLAAAEPQVERIDTWNAASNQHMIAINEALGFEISGPAAISHELPVAKVAI